MHTERWDPSILFYDQCAVKSVTGKGAVVPLDDHRFYQGENCCSHSPTEGAEGGMLLPKEASQTTLP